MVEDIQLSKQLRVFLCHSSDDKTFVRDLYHRLLIDGFNPWLDEENILPGQAWDHEIQKAVRASDVVIVCMSRASVGKVGYVQKEIRYVLDVADEQPEGKIFLIPLKLEECEVPTKLRHWHWVNLFEKRGYERLIQALQTHADFHEIKTPAKGSIAYPRTKGGEGDSNIEQARTLYRTAHDHFTYMEYGQARNLLQRALELDPGDGAIWRLLGRTLVRLGEWQAAIPILTRALELTKVNYSTYLTNRGIAYTMVGEYGRALDDFERSSSRSESSKSPLLLRALVWVHLGEADNALGDINALLEIESKYIPGHAIKAVVLQKLGQKQAAKRALHHAKELGPRKGIDFYYLSLAYSQLEGLQAFIRALRIAIKRDPKYRARAISEPLFHDLMSDTAFRELLSGDQTKDHQG